jgi:hypothetical protein
VAERVIFLAVMMFLITATVGISHNFYWIGKPTGIIALGSVFSTLQVLPLLLITLDAWRAPGRSGCAAVQLHRGEIHDAARSSAGPPGEFERKSLGEEICQCR